jgi:hypothetical protein
MAIPAPNVSRLRPPPPHLGSEGRALWIATTRDYAIDTESLLTHLGVACSSLDRMSECRDQIKAEGLTLDGKAHPLLRVESSARQAFTQSMRALRLASGKK